jgi:hypothetical protein
VAEHPEMSAWLSRNAEARRAHYEQLSETETSGPVGLNAKQKWEGRRRAAIGHVLSLPLSPLGARSIGDYIGSVPKS